MFTIETFYNTKSAKRFAVPTKIIAGVDAVEILTEMINSSDAKSPILVVDTFFKTHPLVEKMFQSKKVQPIEVTSEPTTALVDNALKTISDTPDLIIALGGGSTIDTAKAILAYYLFGDYHTIGYGEKRDITKKNVQIPFIAVPTTAGTGSEMSRYYLISDATTKRKTVSRSWLLCPDYAVLAPDFLQQAPAKVLVHGAFDAFIHLWETYICRYEQSSLTDSLAKVYIPKILSIMAKMRNGKKLNTKDILELQYAAAAGGIALSNVRTGLLHDLGEALSAQVSLPHPETLFIFFDEVMKFYNTPSDHRVKKLLSYIMLEDGTISGIPDIIILWNDLFTQVKSIKNIKTVLEAKELDENAIVEIVLSDQVLVTKESPKQLAQPQIQNIYSKSITKFI